ncbi:MAG: glycosyl hydrolase family 28 protein [Clostridia bacterium]|nr:glycosyl hydrolase family 28 protein [Clostridia bacterium]
MFSYSEFIHDYNLSIYKFKEPISEEYRVIVNGKEVPVYTARISKMSFNRVWPGYQRSAGQTDLVSYVNLVSDEALDIKVIPNFDYKDIMIKPYSKGIGFEDKNGEVSFRIEKEGQYVFLADNFGHTLYIFNSKPIEAPKKEDVTYFFGPGIHMPGKITMKSNESLYVDKDALVYGCIYAENAKNIHIFGNGIFDDSTEGRIGNYCYENFTNGNIKFYDCENIRVEGVGFKDSAIWCVNLFHCSDVVLDNIKVFGQWRYNTDGIDIVNSNNITVKNSLIHSFDDTITIKGIDRYAKFDNTDMLFDNNVLWNDWGNTMEIGIETLCREYKNITFRNSDIIRAGNVALDINDGECAEISNITFENINVEYNKFDSPTVMQDYEDMEYAPETETQIADLIRFRNYIWRTEEMCRIWDIPMLTSPVDLGGIKEGVVHDVTVKNIKVYYDERIPKKDGKYNAPIYVKSERNGVKFYNISLSGISVNGAELDENNSVLDVGDVDNFSFTK